MQRVPFIFFFLMRALVAQAKDDAALKNSVETLATEELSQSNFCPSECPLPYSENQMPSFPYQFHSSSPSPSPLPEAVQKQGSSSSSLSPSSAPPGKQSPSRPSAPIKFPPPPADNKQVLCPPPGKASECESKIKNDGCGLTKDKMHDEKKALDACEGYLVKFNDVSVTELIKFISQIAELNFIYESKDLNDIKITIVSDEPTTVKNLMTSLMQVLRINNFSVVEEGKNIVIYKEPAPIAKVAPIVTDENVCAMKNLPIITRVFRLYNLSPDKVASIIKPLLSKDAIVEQSPETRHLIVSDLTTNVDKIASLLATLDTPNSGMDIAEYAVKSAFPAVLVTYAKEILAPLAQNNPIQFIPQPAAHKIFIVSTPYLINKAIQVLESLDLPEIVEATGISPAHVAGNKFHVYKLKYRPGKDIAQAVRDIGANLRYMSSANVDMISAISSIQWIETNNSLVISGSQDAVDKVITLINDLDVAPKQVYIEVLIIDTTISESLNFGVEWIALGNEQNKLAFASGLLDPPPGTAPIGGLTGTSQPPLFGGARAAQHSPPPNASRGGAPGTGGDIPLTSGFGFGVIGNVIRHHGQNFLTLGGLVKALETDGDTVIVLNPKIMAQDTYEANFFVGQNIPYQTTSTIVRDTGSVTQNLQYEDIGVQLRVVPHIGPNNIVTLDIDQAVSDIVQSTASIDSVGQGPTLLLAPTTTKTLATTRLHVPSGCFLVMSGHIRDQMTRTHQGIPCLGTLPLIGPAFGTTSETRTKRNLIMFLRPHVISDIEEGVELTNREGYNYNWESHPSSLDIAPPPRAPEWESCTNPSSEGSGLKKGSLGGCIAPH